MNGQHSRNIAKHLKDGWFTQLYVADNDGEFGFKWKTEDGVLTVVPLKHGTQRVADNVHSPTFERVLIQHDGPTNIAAVHKSPYDCDWAFLTLVEQS